MSTKRSKGLMATLALFLPGIFLIGFNIGTGSVTTMAKSGANYGMGLLWAVLISCVATYICLLYTSPSPRDQRGSRMPSSA